MERLANAQTKDLIADMIRNEILSGTIADGDELAQEQLAKKLNVSRMPIREALQLLEYEGFLIRLPNRHMQVVGMSKDHILEGMRIIAAMEAEAATLLLERNTDFSTLQDILHKYEASSDSKVLAMTEQLYHMTLMQLVGNGCLLQNFKQLVKVYPGYLWKNYYQQINKENTYGYLYSIQKALQEKALSDLNKLFREYYENLANTLILSLGMNDHE